MKVEIKRYKSGERAGQIRKNVVEIDPQDTWCIPWTISQMLTPLLKQLKGTKHGFGAIKKEDVPECLSETYDDYGFSEKSYNWVLDELIWTFEEVSTDYEGEPYYLEDRDCGEDEDFGEYLRSLKIDEQKKQEWEIYHARLKNGWLLLGKYGQTLWD